MTIDLYEAKKIERLRARRTHKKRQVAAYIDPKIVRRLNIHAAATGLKKQEIIASALSAYLDAQTKVDIA